jgi:hypothetical protein
MPTTSPYYMIVELNNAAQHLLHYLSSQNVFKADVYSTFVTLIHIERAIDACRGLVPPESSFSLKEDKAEANKLLDELRRQIHVLRSTLNDEEVKEILRERGEDFKLRFLQSNPTPSE